MEIIFDAILCLFAAYGITHIVYVWYVRRVRRQAERRLADYVNNYSRNNGARKAYQAYTRPK